MINLKNKKIGYFLVMANTVLALVLGIIFFATYKDAMANNAWGLVPETIGIFALAAAALELVVVFLPQYKFVHIGALVMIGVSFYKEVITVPNLIADEVNNVHYQGGDLKTNIVYIVLQVILIMFGIAVCFMDLYADEEEEIKEFKEIKGTNNLVKLGVAGAVVVAAVLASTLVTNDLTQKANIGGGAGANDSSNTGTNAGGSGETGSKEESKKWDPITDDIKAKAAASTYSFDPTTVSIEKEESYNFNSAELSAVSVGATSRDGKNIVYYFEGSYAEGYQGDYTPSYASIYLWDDGIFTGKAKDTSIKGYWYNKKDGTDCLEMVSSYDHYDSIICEDSTGFYTKQAYCYLNMGWGQRSIIVGGYMYYPEVALFIDADTNGEPVEYTVGEKFDRSDWVANRVLKNLTYSSVFKADEVRWEDGAGIKDGQVITAAGDYTVKATWNGLEASINVHVKEAPAESAPAESAPTSDAPAA